MIIDGEYIVKGHTGIKLKYRKGFFTVTEFSECKSKFRLFGCEEFFNRSDIERISNDIGRKRELQFYGVGGILKLKIDDIELDREDKLLRFTVFLKIGYDNEFIKYEMEESEVYSLMHNHLYCIISCISSSDDRDWFYKCLVEEINKAAEENFINLVGL